MKHIPVRDTVTAAYAYTFGNIGKLVGLVWLPALLTFAGSYLFVRPYLYFTVTNPGQDEILQHGPLMVGMYAYYLFSVVFFAMMAAGIANDVLHPDKEPGMFRFPPFRAVIRVTGGAFGLLLLLSLFMAGVGLVMKAAGGALPGPAMDAIVFVVALALIYLGIRLSFFFVPAATEDKCFGLVRSWQLSKGHFWRILGIMICCVLPVVVVSMLAQFAILGPDYYANFHVSGALTQADNARMLLMADRFWLVSGVSFFLTPFAYGLYAAPSAALFRMLTDEVAGDGGDDSADNAGESHNADAPEEAPEKDEK